MTPEEYMQIAIEEAKKKAQASPAPTHLSAPYS